MPLPAHAGLCQVARVDLVPTIDISQPSNTELAAVDAACRDHGFFLLRGHGLDDLVTRMWQETERFFEAPASVKEAIRRNETQPLGWNDRELTKRRRDCKEVFDYMQPGSEFGEVRNRWPDALPGFRETQHQFFEAFSDLAARTLALVERALGAPAGRIVGSAAASTVRLNWYPTVDPVPEREREGLAELGDNALGYHTDPGVLTLLLQDATGGLQAHSRAEGWIDVPPAEGTIVVNLADSLQVWSNDRYRAAVHRVTPIKRRSRYSIPYFYNPTMDAVIEPIAELGSEPPLYRPFTWREFILARAHDNYTDLGAEDTQASHFRVR